MSKDHPLYAMYFFLHFYFFLTPLLISFLLFSFHTYTFHRLEYHLILYYFYYFYALLFFSYTVSIIAAEEARLAERESEEAATAKIKRDRLARVAADNEKSSSKAGKTGPSILLQFTVLRFCVYIIQF
jgi:Ca2+/Na+ antiporter